MSAGLQVLVPLLPGAPAVAGLPPAVRSAFRAGRELSPARIVIPGADADFLRRWSFQFRACGAPVTGDAALDPGAPALRLAGDAFPDEGALAAFLAAAAAGGRRELHGRDVAEYAPRAADLGAPRPALEAGAFLEARTPAQAAASARVLYSRLGKDNDGYLARFDRTLSIALTRLMLPFPISPNQVTAASLLLGLLGAWWLAAPSRACQFAGALLLWFCALLDGCDGEIARLKHHVTPWGGDFDLWADHVAHLATFVALPVGVARLNPGTDWTLPGVLLVTGFLGCGHSVWRLVLRVPEAERGPLALVVERVASRDYVYLLVALTAVGRLDWFVWATALGSHAFWIGLWALSLGVKRPTPLASPRSLPPSGPS